MAIVMSTTSVLSALFTCCCWSTLFVALGEKIMDDIAKKSFTVMKERKYRIQIQTRLPYLSYSTQTFKS